GRAIVAVDRTGHRNRTLWIKQPVALILRDLQVVGDILELLPRHVEHRTGVDIAHRGILAKPDCATAVTRIIGVHAVPAKNWVYPDLLSGTQPLVLRQDANPSTQQTSQRNAQKMQSNTIKLDPEVAVLAGKIDFNPDALLNKYLSERDKRLRPDGFEQYIEVKAEFSRYVEDPYVEPGFTRAPVFDEVEFAIIGGGFGGLLVGARLREAGVESIRVVESAGDFGGTWYWNRYPGAMCDVESYCYLPLLEELNYMPKHKYSFAPEILEHSKAIARHYNLYDNALLQTAITGMEWDEAAKRWIISTHRGDRFRAKYVAMANGPLNRPKLPGIPGINEFKGHT